jgi:uncharacterized protein YndB with AHSA1/START domain
MSIKVTIETDIARPPAVVFAALADVDTWPAWLIATGIVRVTRASADPLAAGAAVTIDQRAAGRSSTVAATVTAMDSPARFAIAGRDADGIATELDAELLAIEDGATRLRWSARIDVPLRYRVFESMVAPQVQRAAALDVEAFKHRLESAPAG